MKGLASCPDCRGKGFVITASGKNKMPCYRTTKFRPLKPGERVGAQEPLPR